MLGPQDLRRPGLLRALSMLTAPPDPSSGGAVTRRVLSVPARAVPPPVPVVDPFAQDAAYEFGAAHVVDVGLKADDVPQVVGDTDFPDLPGRRTTPHDDNPASPNVVTYVRGFVLLRSQTACCAHAGMGGRSLPSGNGR